LETDKVLLPFQTILPHHWPIKGIASQVLYIIGVGDIAINCLLEDTWKHRLLEQVLYVLGLTNNLFFFARAASKEIQTTCSRTGCLMTHHNIYILHTTIQGVMYKLNIYVIYPNDTTHAMIVASFCPKTMAEERQTLQI
jgi:hypothetical protein